MQSSKDSREPTKLKGHIYRRAEHLMLLVTSLRTLGCQVESMRTLMLRLRYPLKSCCLPQSFL
eukprot:2946815-Amphidinium_carterae.1